MIEQENDLTRKLFDLEQVIDFQMKHEVQIIRGEDYNYMAYIDRKVWGLGLTPLGALINGIIQYNANKEVR